MKVWIDQTYCTGSGLCAAIEPRVFALDDKGLAGVLHEGQVVPLGPDDAAPVPVEFEADVRDASESCPGECIRLES